MNEEIATDPEQPAKDRIEASKVAVEGQTHIFDMLKEGPKLTNTQLLSLPTQPQPELLLLNEPEWYNRKKEKIWESMTYPEKIRRLYQGSEIRSKK